MVLKWLFSSQCSAARIGYQFLFLGNVVFPFGVFEILTDEEIHGYQ